MLFTLMWIFMAVWLIFGMLGSGYWLKTYWEGSALEKIATGIPAFWMVLTGPLWFYYAYEEWKFDREFRGK